MNEGVCFVIGTIVGCVFGFIVGGVMRSAKECNDSFSEDEGQQ